MDANSIFQSALRCHQAGDLLQAENLYRETIQYNPYHADAYYNLGIILQSRAGIHGAISCYETAVQLNPDLTDAYYNLGIAYAKIFEYKKASAYYMEAIKKNPSDFEAFSNLAGILCEQGKWNESEACFRKALEIYPSSPNIYSALLMAMNFNPQNTPEKILLEHRKFAGSFSKSAHPAGYSNNLKSSRKLRIGYISPDFRNHSVAFFISPVIKAHDRKQFEIFCYADVFTGDEVTKSIQNSTDHWVVTIGMPDETVIELIREHEIDILIDLAGHAVNNRMSVFAGNPAPVQISWIGYPATTGLPSVDYKIVDSYTDPPGMTEQFYTENLLRMPETFLCYLPPFESPDVGNLPANSTGHITFGSFNHYSKISPDVLELWSRLLKSIPGARLILKAKSFACQTVRDYVKRKFSQDGVDTHRIEFHSWKLSTSEHLDLYNQIDIGLDTFPYNGTTTTCEALWMGVPVATLAGDRHSSRTGVSLLTNIGLPDLIAGNHDEYILIAKHLAQDIERLQALRSNLRNMMIQSPLTNAARLTNHLEHYLQVVWEKWKRSVTVRK